MCIIDTFTDIAKEWEVKKCIHAHMSTKFYMLTLTTEVVVHLRAVLTLNCMYYSVPVYFENIFSTQPPLLTRHSLNGKQLDIVSMGNKQTQFQWETNRHGLNGKQLDLVSMGNNQTQSQWETTRHSLNGKHTTNLILFLQ